MKIFVEIDVAEFMSCSETLPAICLLRIDNYYLVVLIS